MEDRKCVLKRSHAYYYQCQQILLVTGRTYCDFILHAGSGPDSVERITRDEPLMEKIVRYLTALWTRAIAPKVFEMRVPRGLIPFVLTESVDFLDYCEPHHTSPGCEPQHASPGCEPQHPSPVCVLKPDDPTTCTSLASPINSVEPDATPESPAGSVDHVTPDSSYTPEELNVAEALLVPSVSGPTCQQEQELTIFPWGGLTSIGISLTNTCPLDNWLMIFQALVKSNKVKLTDLPESGHIIQTALRLIDDGQYGDSKLLVLQSLPQQQQGMLLYASSFFIVKIIILFRTNRGFLSRVSQQRAQRCDHFSVHINWLIRG